MKKYVFMKFLIFSIFITYTVNTLHLYQISTLNSQNSRIYVRGTIFPKKNEPTQAKTFNTIPKIKYLTNAVGNKSVPYPTDGLLINVAHIQAAKKVCKRKRWEAKSEWHIVSTHTT